MPRASSRWEFTRTAEVSADVIPLLLILAQLTVRIDGQAWTFAVPESTYTQCASYVTGQFTRHLYCAEGELIYALAPVTAGFPLTGCTVESVDSFRRRLTCAEGVVGFGYVEAFLLGTIRYQ